MRPILAKLGFVPMAQFIEEKLGMKLDCDGIFIKCKHEFPSLSMQKAMSNSDILSHALETCCEGNQLCNGYCKTAKRWYSTNTSRNLLKSQKWAEIFDVLGCEYSIFILTKCSIVEKVDQSLVFVCGDFGENIERKHARSGVDREKIFYGREELAQVSLENAIAEILGPCIEGNEKVMSILAKVLNEFNKLPLKSLFKSFFSQQLCRLEQKAKSNKQVTNSSSESSIQSQQDDNIASLDLCQNSGESIVDDQISPECIADFLFMVSKKFLRPAFSLRDFKVLKGKLVLLLKRNIYETISKEELVKYLKISKFKLFRGTEGLGFPEKLCITGKLFLFLFNRIYLNVLSFFFYSTSSSFSKAKVLYFTRIEWNIKANQFFSKHLERFGRVKSSSHLATLRCIPKESGFRVVSNCSKTSSYASKVRMKKIDKRIQNRTTELAGAHAIKPKNVLLSLEKIQRKYDEIDSILQCSFNGREELETPVQCPIGSAVSALEDKTAKELREGPKCKFKIKYNSCAWTCSEVENCTNMKDLSGHSRLNENARIGVKENAAQAKILKNTFPSINSMVAPIHPILKKESQGKIGYSLIDHRDVRTRLFPFLKSANQRLYMMKVDLSKCFDNIPQKDLISVLDSLLKKDAYYFQEFILLKENDIGDRVDIKYVRKAPDILYPLNVSEGHLDDADVCDFDRNFIIKENKIRVFSRSEIISKIKNTVENATVFYQNIYYRPSKGIPQGCCISPILCALYYGHLDREFEHLNGFISRFVDDFLIITSHMEVIREFFKIAHGLRDKGFIINRSKICANFDIEAALMDPASQKDVGSQTEFTTSYIEWCGMKIYNNSIAVKSILNDKYFRYSVHITESSRGKKIFAKIKRSLMAKCSSLYISRLNTKSGENMFDAFYCAGRKLRILILRADFINKAFVRGVLDWCIEEAKAVVKKRKMLFDEEKIDSIAKKAFEKCDVFDIAKKSFNR